MLGVKIKGVSEDFDELPIAGYEEMLREVAAAYPNLKLIASTLRTAHSASRNGWGAIAIYQDQIVHVPQRDIEICDRVGGGDSFASGLIYGLLVNKPIEWAVKCGVAHGALAMTTPATPAWPHWPKLNASSKAAQRESRVSPLSPKRRLCPKPQRKSSNVLA